MTRVLRSLVLCLLVSLPVCAWATEATTPQRYRFANGIEAIVYPPQYILEHMTVRVGDDLMFVVDNVRYHFIESTDDFMVSNHGDGEFYPMNFDTVVEAIDSVTLEDAGLKMRAFVLPYPRREVVDSSARADMIFLSPGVREVSDYAIHFTVTHEVGHLYQYRWLPDHEVHAWNYYRQMRGIQDHGRYNAASHHADRPHEVFAEDFRFFFGGTQANYSGSIENHELALPSEVDGLEDFIASLRDGLPSFAARLRSVPNPFNPNTEIRVEFDTPPGPTPVQVEVYDARGILVRRLHSGPVEDRMLRLPWDGTAEDGVPVSSGVYYARVDFAGTQSSTKLVLLK